MLSGCSLHADNGVFGMVMQAQIHSLMNFQISLKPPNNSKKTFTCLEISISTLIYHVQILDHSWMSFKHMHYINTFHFLHMFMVIGSTCLLLDLLALTLKQYFLLMVYQITIVSLSICGCKLVQNLEKK